MTDLQVSLLAAGGVFIAGVYTYNKWQEYKAKKTVERAFATDHDDVLMRAGEASRQEPSFDLGLNPIPGSSPGFDAEPSGAPADDFAPIAPVQAPVGPDGLTPAAELANTLVDPL